MIGARNDRQFAGLCAKISDCLHAGSAGEKDLATQVRELPQHDDYRTNSWRVQNRVKLIEILESALQLRSVEEWMTAFSDAEFPFAPVNNLEKAFAHPQVRQSGFCACPYLD
jgi:succinate--hydroxymethylglutarate CoA-transferase